MNKTNNELTKDQTEFLEALHDLCDGYHEFRALPSSRRIFSNNPHELSEFIKGHKQENLFVGIATRKDHSSGRLDNCQHLGAVFIDVDFKDVAEEEAWKRIKDRPLPPSILVRSGNGLHVYWLLKEPLDLQDPDDLALARKLLRRLARYFHADMSAAEPARVLRLPGTLNLKYEPPCQVSVEFLHADRRYEPLDFDEWLPEEPLTNDKGKGAGGRLSECISEGKRNKTLHTLGRRLHHQGLQEHEILATLREVNRTRCKPQLDDEEIQRIAHNAATQSDRPDFHPRMGQNASSDLPQINAGIGDLKTASQLAWDALERTNHPPRLFRYGGLPTRLEWGDGEAMPVIRELSRDRMRYELARAARYFRVTQQGTLDSKPPLEVVRDLLASPTSPLPVLRRIAEVPVFASDGTLLQTQGYHPSSQLYLTLQNLQVPAVPEQPTQEDIDKAKQLLLYEPLIDFSFVDQADRAHAAGLALLPYARDLILGPTPMHLIEAPDPGCGKGLLADTLLRPSMGANLGVLAQPQSVDEWRKRLTACFREARSLILLDNITRRLDTGVLAAALTSNTWDDPPTRSQ